MGDLVLTQIDAPIVTLTFNRAERHNSLVPGLLEEVLASLSQIQDMESVNAVVLQANGRSFSTGGDLRDFFQHLDQVERYSLELVGLLNQVILAMRDLRQPVVAAVHGVVTGGSLGLLLASDIVLMAPNATITPYYSVVGFSPDGGWTAWLPFIIGEKRAAEILMRNLTVSAEQAVRWGIANRVVPQADIRREAQEIAMEIAWHQSGSVQQSKRLLSGNDPGLAIRLEAERQSFASQISKAETQESMVAFLEEM